MTATVRAIALTLILTAHGADLWLTYVYTSELHHGIVETNPWARWLYNEHGTAGLVAVKALTLSVSLSILALLWRRDSWYTDLWLALGVVVMSAVSWQWWRVVGQIHG